MLVQKPGTSRFAHTARRPSGRSDYKSALFLWGPFRAPRFRRSHIFTPLLIAASARPALLTVWDDGRSELGTKVGATGTYSYDTVGPPSFSGGRMRVLAGTAALI